MHNKIKIFLLMIICFSLGLILDSCCKGYKYRWEYIITQTLDSEEITENDSIKAENFGIRINLISQKFAENSFNPFIENAYAYDCFPKYTIIDTIVELNIITLNDLDENFLAGSDVTTLFTGSLFYTSILSVEELLQEINQLQMGEVEYFNLFLNYNIAISSYQQFRIIIELSDNRVLEGEVREIWLY